MRTLLEKLRERVESDAAWEDLVRSSQFSGIRLSKSSVDLLSVLALFQKDIRVSACQRLLRWLRGTTSHLLKEVLEVFVAESLGELPHEEAKVDLGCHVCSEDERAVLELFDGQHRTLVLKILLAALGYFFLDLGTPEERIVSEDKFIALRKVFVKEPQVGSISGDMQDGTGRSRPDDFLMVHAGASLKCLHLLNHCVFSFHHPFLQGPAIQTASNRRGGMPHMFSVMAGSADQSVEGLVREGNGVFTRLVAEAENRDFVESLVEVAAVCFAAVRDLRAMGGPVLCRFLDFVMHRCFFLVIKTADRAQALQNFLMINDPRSSVPLRLHEQARATLVGTADEEPEIVRECFWRMSGVAFAVADSARVDRGENVSDLLRNDFFVALAAAHSLLAKGTFPDEGRSSPVDLLRIETERMPNGALDVCRHLVWPALRVAAAAFLAPLSNPIGIWDAVMSGHSHLFRPDGLSSPRRFRLAVPATDEQGLRLRDIESEARRDQPLRIFVSTAHSELCRVLPIGSIGQPHVDRTNFLLLPSGRFVRLEVQDDDGTSSSSSSSSRSRKKSADDEEDESCFVVPDLVGNEAFSASLGRVLALHVDSVPDGLAELMLAFRTIVRLIDNHTQYGTLQPQQRVCRYVPWLATVLAAHLKGRGSEEEEEPSGGLEKEKFSGGGASSKGSGTSSKSSGASSEHVSGLGMEMDMVSAAKMATQLVRIELLFMVLGGGAVLERRQEIAGRLVQHCGDWERMERAADEIVLHSGGERKYTIVKTAARILHPDRKGRRPAHVLRENGVTINYVLRRVLPFQDVTNVDSRGLWATLLLAHHAAPNPLLASAEDEEEEDIVEQRHNDDEEEAEEVRGLARFFRCEAKDLSGQGLNRNIAASLFTLDPPHRLRRVEVELRDRVTRLDPSEKHAVCVIGNNELLPEDLLGHVLEEAAMSERVAAIAAFPRMHLASSSFPLDIAARDWTAYVAMRRGIFLSHAALVALSIRERPVVGEGSDEALLRKRVDAMVEDRTKSKKKKTKALRQPDAIRKKRKGGRPRNSQRAKSRSSRKVGPASFLHSLGLQGLDVEDDDENVETEDEEEEEEGFVGRHQKDEEEEEDDVSVEERREDSEEDSEEEEDEEEDEEDAFEPSVQDFDDPPRSLPPRRSKASAAREALDPGASDDLAAFSASLGIRGSHEQQQQHQEATYDRDSEEENHGVRGQNTGATRSPLSGHRKLSAGSKRKRVQSKVNDGPDPKRPSP